MARKKDAKTYTLLNPDGSLAPDYYKKTFSQSIKDALGKTVEELMRENEAEIARGNEKVEQLRTERENADENQRPSIERQIQVEQDNIDRLEQQNERFRNRMALKERIKEIFKKYGLTAFFVLAAVGAIIGVIVSNLKNGLATLGRGLGNGLKAIGKKLGQILPGMVGAIASFIFRTAGEAIGFLGKHAWLLFVAVVMFAVEQFKKKRS